MTFRSDDRGVTVQVGTILLFATLVVAMSLYQATAIPSQNAKVEFRHNERVQSQMQDVRNSIIRTGATGTGQPTSVTLGTQYRGHVFFVTPPPASGSLRTTELGAINVENLTATDPETAQYFGGDDLSFSTRALVYAPNYNQYGNAPDTVYENSILYNRGKDGNATLTDQQLVHGRRITLVTLDGTLSQSRSGTVSLDPHVSSPSTTTTRTISVRADGSDPVIRIPTTLDAEKWTRLLEDQRVENGGYVENVGVEDGMLRLELRGTENGRPATYTLRMANVGVGSSIDGTNATYITNVGPRTVPTNGTTTLVAEVRDRYNNPVSGVTVNSTTGVSAETDERGQVRVDYDPTAVGTGTVTLSIEDNSTERERVEFPIHRVASDGGGAYDVAWVDSTGLDCNDALDACTLDRSESSTATLTATVTYDGDHVTGTNVDFGLNRTGIITTAPQAATTDGNGRVETSIDASSTGDVKLLAASGGNADSVVVDVIQSGDALGIVYNEDAVATRGYRNNGAKSGLVFSVTNELPTDATLTDVRVTPRDSRIDRLSDPSTGEGRYESELHVEAERDGTSDIGGGVSLPTTIDIDSDGQQFSFEAPLRREPRIAGNGGTATFYLYQFERNGSPVDMRHEAVDVTLYFDEHDSVEFTLNERDDGDDGGQSRADIEYALSDTSENSNARYRLSYDVTGTSDFDRLEVQYRNIDETYDSASGRYETTDSRGRTDVFTAGGTMGDDYEIVLTAYDAAGNVLGTERGTDTADGRSPPGDDLRQPSSPQLRNVVVSDDTNVRGDEGQYQVSYDVSKSESFDSVEVAFRNLDHDWGTKSRTDGRRNGDVQYRQGGTARDEYEIIVRVLDGDGIVVDSRTITDTADGNDP